MVIVDFYAQETGGVVALYINETLQPNYLPNKSKCIDNCAEIVTVEVTLATGENVLVSCVYRAPNTNVDILSDFFLEILRNNRNKHYICAGTLILTCCSLTRTILLVIS